MSTLRYRFDYYGNSNTDMPVASTGVYVATEIGATNAFAYDLQQLVPVLWNVNCSCIQSGRYKRMY
jgi:3-oxoacyl-[acyl-carrier-protein] synthase-3